MTWLQEWMDSTRELESPRSFWYWAGLATISAVLKDNVWLNRGKAYKLYPNIYVMFLADSALRKGPPVSKSKEVVRLVNNTRIISGRSSIQGILKEMGTAQTSPGGKINTKSCAYFTASEFSASLVEDHVAFDILTDLYDRHFNEGEWQSLLKSEKFNLRDPILSMLVATNDPHLKGFIQERDIYGGFFGRIFVIRESEVFRLNSLVDDLINPPDAAKFVPYMKKLSVLSGEFESLSGTPQGKLYDSWYTEFFKTVHKQKIEDKTGTLGRFGDSVLKVAMLLSLSKEPVLRITMEAMEEALTVCEKFVEGVRKTTMGHSGKAQYADQKAIIMAELLDRPDHRITRTQLLKKFWMHFNADELDIMMRSFDEAGMIKPHNVGSTLIYEMPESIAIEIGERLRGRK